MSGKDNTEGREQIEARLAELGARYADNPQDLLVVKEIAELYWRLEEWQDCASYYEYAFSLDNSEPALKSRAEAAREKISGQPNVALPVENSDTGNDGKSRKSRVKDLRPKREKRQSEVLDELQVNLTRAIMFFILRLTCRRKNPGALLAAIQKGANQLRAGIPAIF